MPAAFRANGCPTTAAASSHPAGIEECSEYNNRAHLIWQHQQQFTPTLSGGIDYNQVSDNDYYRDFYGRDDIASNVNLNRQAWLNRAQYGSSPL